MATMIVNPKPFLTGLVGKNVAVKLKWGTEYRGKLASFDSYMNVQLQEAEEFLDGEFAGKLGELLIRCNNVLYVRQAPTHAETEGPAAAAGEAKATDAGEGAAASAGSAAMEDGSGS